MAPVNEATSRDRSNVRLALGCGEGAVCEYMINENASIARANVARVTEHHLLVRFAMRFSVFLSMVWMNEHGGIAHPMGCKRCPQRRGASS